MKLSVNIDYLKLLTQSCDRDLYKCHLKCFFLCDYVPSGVFDDVTSDIPETDYRYNKERERGGGRGRERVKRIFECKVCPF